MKRTKKQKIKDVLLLVFCALLVIMIFWSIQFTVMAELPSFSTEIDYTYADGTNPSLTEILYMVDTARLQAECGGLNTRLYLNFMYKRAGVVYGIFTNEELTGTVSLPKTSGVKMEFQIGSYENHSSEGRICLNGSSGTDFVATYVTYQVAMFNHEQGWILSASATSGYLYVYLDEMFYCSFTPASSLGNITVSGTIPSNFTPGDGNKNHLWTSKQFWTDVKMKLTSDQYQNGYNDGFSDGYETGKADGFTNGYETGFNDGYETGLDEGTNVGYHLGYVNGREDGYYDGNNDGYDSGFSDGYETGYNAGYNNGIENGDQGYQLDIPSIITSVPTAAKGFINTAFDIEIFGINVAGLLSTLIIIAIVVVGVSFLLGKIGSK